MRTFTFDEAVASCLDYFKGDLLAATTVAKKYLVRDEKNLFTESEPYGMHRRMALEFTRIERKMRGSLDGSTYFTEVLGLLNHFRKTVPQGSPMAAIGNPYQLQSLSNCFVVESPTDDIAGIFNTGKEIAQIQKRRGGVGVDLSSLRPSGSRVNNAAITSSGVPCFSDFYSYVTRMIGQLGRQGALMITLDIRHPDVARFATMKQDLKKVTGANVSIKISDAFMRAVRDNKTFRQQWPVDASIPEIIQDVNARELWDTIVDSAWKTAEPGLLMWDNYCRNLPAHNYPGFQTLSTNPCAELGLSPYDSCRLISQNLYGWVKEPFTKHAEFDFDEYYRDTKTAQRMSDGLVELELEVVEQIIQRSTVDSEKVLWRKIWNAAHDGRRTGLGTHALADVFLAVGLRYDSDEAVKFADKLYETHKLASYDASMDMAEERGPFPLWKWETDAQSEFIQRLPADRLARLKKVGRRNIANLTLAPTGSVAVASQTSSGCEAVFRFVYDRFVKITHSDLGFKVDRTDAMGDRWTKFRVVHPAARHWLEANGVECPVKEGNDDLPLEEANARMRKLLPEHFVTSDEINYLKGVELQAAITRHIDHGVSRTINLPKGSTKEAVHQVYFKSWELGLKGVTVYVDGSRDGVLVTETQKKAQEADRPALIIDNHAPKRPDSLMADIYHVKVKGQDWAVVVGLLNNRPYEIFAGQGLVIPKQREIESAQIARKSQKKYVLEMALKGGETTESEDLREIYDCPEQRTITRSVCRELRHGVPIEFIVKDLQDHEGAFTDYSAVLARVLKKYVSRPNLIVKICPDCGGKEFEMHEGCIRCSSCNSSKCS